MSSLDLEALGACEEAREWYEEHGGTPDRAWEDCPRGDWLLWLAARAGVDRRLVILAACDCAETADGYLDESTRGPARAVLDAARRWTRGEATLGAVRAAYAAASAAYAVYADSDAYAAASAAYAADSAAYAAASAAYAADSAAYAAAGASRSESLATSAVLVRARIPWAQVAAALEVTRDP